jgi:ATP-independent RNA helicase DbpA
LPPTAFASLPLATELLSVAAELGFEHLTPIQEQSIPLLLEGKDLIGQSKTGSGKTVAFALPILQNIDLSRKQVQALILCPTRELCSQVAREMRRLGRRLNGLQVLIVAGGLPPRPQADALRRGVHIVVGTPGRVLDHGKRGRLDVESVNTLVLDEADRMLDMGFQEDMEQILAELPDARQTVFFSATFPESMEELSERYQFEPLRVTVEESEQSMAQITQLLHLAEQDEKADALLQILKIHQPESAIVFCNLKVTVAELAATLARHQINCAALHGDLEQYDRDRVMAQFRNRSIRVLIATDVAARGLDIESLQMVVNFDFPKEAESYIHRIGRTGRAGRQGVAISLLTARQAGRLQQINEGLGSALDTPLALSEIGSSPAATDALERANPPVINLTEAEMQTLYIGGGRKEKVRPGDILGALTGDAGLLGVDIGKIEIHDHFSYVAVSKKMAAEAERRLSEGKIKGRKFIVKLAR